MAYQNGEIIFDKYRIEKQIGEGTFGEVYLVTHLKLNMLRVIKLIRHDAETMNDPNYREIRQQFQQEAQIGARLNHPALIRVFDFDESEDLMSIAMEYASGGSLVTMMAEKNMGSGSSVKPGLEISRVIEIAAQIAEGLAAIHALDIVHRDLKPSNILFDENGQAKIADLGLAQIKDGKSQRSQSDSQMEKKTHPGTPAYMSPEQETSPKYLTTASDIYTFGLILFEMLTGRLYKNLRPGTRVHDVRPDTPEWLDELVTSALSDKPEQRPWSGEELVKIFAEHDPSKKIPISQTTAVAAAPSASTDIPAVPAPLPEKARLVEKPVIEAHNNKNRLFEFISQYRMYLIIGVLAIGLIIILLISGTKTRAATSTVIANSNKSSTVVSVPTKANVLALPTSNSAEITKLNKTLFGKWTVTRVVGFPAKSRPWQDVGNIMEFGSNGLMKMTTYEGMAGGGASYKMNGDKVIFIFEDGHKDTWLLTIYEFKGTAQLNKEGTDEIMDLSRVK